MLAAGAVPVRGEKAQEFFAKELEGVVRLSLIALNPHGVASRTFAVIRPSGAVCYKRSLMGARAGTKQLLHLLQGLSMPDGSEDSRSCAVRNYNPCSCHVRSLPNEIPVVPVCFPGDALRQHHQSTTCRRKRPSGVSAECGSKGLRTGSGFGLHRSSSRRLLRHFERLSQGRPDPLCHPDCIE